MKFILPLLLLLAVGSSLKIYNDWSLWDDSARYSETRSVPQTQRDYLRYNMVPALTSYWEGVLTKKKPVSSILVQESDWNCDSDILSYSDLSSDLTTDGGVSGDHVIIWRWADMKSVAETSTCMYADMNDGGHPLVSIISIGYSGTVPDSNTFRSIIDRESQLNAFHHEMMHAFGMTGSSARGRWIDWENSTPNNLKNYQNPTPTRPGYKDDPKVSHYVLATPNITSFLRTYHGCNNLQGLFLEYVGVHFHNDLHFKASLYPMEAMISGRRWGQRITNVSLIALSDSGFYDINYTFAEPLYHAKGVDCEYFTNDAQGNNQAFSDERGNGEFCEAGDVEVGCDFYNRFRGTCLRKWEKDDGARIIGNDDDGARVDCWDKSDTSGIYGKKGWQNGCFVGALGDDPEPVDNTYCLPFECYKVDGVQKLNVTIAGNNYTCPESGQINISNEGSLLCPLSPERYCEITQPYCVKGCYNNGKCTANKKCDCNPGWTGQDCSVPSDYPNEDFIYKD